MHPTHFETAQSKDILAAARRQFDDFKPKQPNPNLRAELQHGWMVPTLLHVDDCLWGRWNYWANIYDAEALPPEPIPRLDLLGTPHPATRKMIEASLNCIPSHGAWRTWSGWSYFDFYLDWMLFGLGHKGQRELPNPPAGCEGASDRLYQVFCLDAILVWPHDYFGDLLCESSYGKQQGFYPTPHTVCEFMTQMVCDEKRDIRAETVLDPCVGTGRFLLHASNHSLRLFGMDIDVTLCKATLVNGYCYAPWMVRPIPWLDSELAALERMPATEQSVHQQIAAELSDDMTNAAPPHARSYLSDTEHDPVGQPCVAPLLKRRKRRDVDPTQGSLF